MQEPNLERRLPGAGATLLASAAFGLGSMIAAHHILPDAGEFSHLRADVAACAADLTDHGVITTEPPEPCTPFQSGMEAQAWQVAREDRKGDAQLYRLPSEQEFRDDKDNELDNQRNAGRWAIGMSGLLGAMVSFPVNYHVVSWWRERRQLRAETEQAAAVQPEQEKDLAFYISQLS